MYTKQSGGTSGFAERAQISNEAKESRGITAQRAALLSSNPQLASGGLGAPSPSMSITQYDLTAA